MILRGRGEFDIVENGINMSKRRSQAASSTVFFAFWILWMPPVWAVWMYVYHAGSCFPDGGSGVFRMKQFTLSLVKNSLRPVVKLESWNNFRALLDTMFFSVDLVEVRKEICMKCKRL